MTWQFEAAPKRYLIAGGFTIREWGLGIVVNVGSTEAQLQASLGPLWIDMTRFR